MCYIWAVLSLILIFDLIKQQKNNDFLPEKKTEEKNLESRLIKVQLININ